MRRRLHAKIESANSRESFLRHLAHLEWKYHNLILLFLSIIVAAHILTYKPSVPLAGSLDDLGYVAAFAYGMIYTYAMTTAPATALIFNLGGILNPLLIAMVGAFGSVLSDYIIFRFVRDSLMDEIRLLERGIERAMHHDNNHHLAHKKSIWKAISGSKAWQAVVPVIAGLIIASPLPDELGAAIFGAIRFDSRKFAVISYFLNFTGILVISYLGSL